MLSYLAISTLSTYCTIYKKKNFNDESKIKKDQIVCQNPLARIIDIYMYIPNLNSTHKNKFDFLIYIWHNITLLYMKIDTLK